MRSLRRGTLAHALRPALRARERTCEPTDRIESVYLRLLPAHLASGRSPLPCASGRASVFVDPAGGVWPCTVYAKRLGSLHERPLPEILDGPAAARARAVVARDGCPGCWSPCEANPTIVAGLPESLLVRTPRGARRR